MIKIFFKKDYYRVLEKKVAIEKELKEYKESSSDIISHLEDKCFEYLKENSALKDLKLDVEKVKEDLKKANGEKGGLTKENNKLKKENDKLIQEVAALKKQLEESMTDKYLVKKIKPGRTPNTNKTKISKPMSGNVRKFMKDNFD